MGAGGGFPAARRGSSENVVDDLAEELEVTINLGMWARNRDDLECQQLVILLVLEIVEVDDDHEGDGSTIERRLLAGG